MSWSTSTSPWRRRWWRETAPPIRTMTTYREAVRTKSGRGWPAARKAAAAETPRWKAARLRSARLIWAAPRLTTAATRCASTMPRRRWWWSPESGSASASNAAGFSIFVFILVFLLLISSSSVLFYALTWTFIWFLVVVCLCGFRAFEFVYYSTYLWFLLLIFCLIIVEIIELWVVYITICYKISPFLFIYFITN